MVELFKKKLVVESEKKRSWEQVGLAGSARRRVGMDRLVAASAGGPCLGPGIVFCILYLIR